MEPNKNRIQTPQRVEPQAVTMPASIIPQTINKAKPGTPPPPRVAIRIVTGGYAPPMGEELKGTRVPNSYGGTKKSTRLTSKYVLRGKTKKAKIIIRQLK